jgi:hypothetical protein
MSLVRRGLQSRWGSVGSFCYRCFSNMQGMGSFGRCGLIGLAGASWRGLAFFGRAPLRRSLLK